MELCTAMRNVGIKTQNTSFETLDPSFVAESLSFNPRISVKTLQIKSCSENVG